MDRERKGKHRFLGLIFIIICALVFSWVLQCSIKDKEDEPDGGGEETFTVYHRVSAQQL